MKQKTVLTLQAPSKQQPTLTGTKWAFGFLKASIPQHCALWEHTARVLLFLTFGST